MKINVDEMKIIINNAIIDRFYCKIYSGLPFRLQVGQLLINRVVTTLREHYVTRVHKLYE
jgi:hypothetical protein